MATRSSTGCLPCRARKVKCDEGRPSCLRCIRRGDLCTGYRDPVSLLFRDENAKAQKLSMRRRASTKDVSSSSSLLSRDSRITRTGRSPADDPSMLPSAKLSGLDHCTPCLSNKAAPAVQLSAEEDQAVPQFFEKYVMYPCNQSSSPGFLEYLPFLFEEVRTEGRLALRWAVYAAAYASLSNDEDRVDLGDKAMHCYGQALSALAKGLSEPGWIPDDYVLMTVVVLDLFETLHFENPLSKGSHAQGMAQILRLRGADQIYDPRGWSLFRLAHHRVQRQQFMVNRKLLPEATTWLNSLNEMLPYVQTEKNNLEINKVCQRARDLRQRLENIDLPLHEILEMIEEMQQLDRVTESWRTGPQWTYRSIHRSDITGDRKQIESANFPEFVQLHRDVWIAYEWNYHRTARILLHEQLLRCLHQLENLYPTVQDNVKKTLVAFKRASVGVIQTLADDILATVPQSLGDIDHEGQAVKISKCNAVGGYFLLWSIKILKSTQSVTDKQRTVAQAIFYRIRECTGMKSTLGELSNI